MEASEKGGNQFRGYFELRESLGYRPTPGGMGLF
jgi:hypothetical protein